VPPALERRQQEGLDGSVTRCAAQGRQSIELIRCIALAAGMTLLAFPLQVLAQTLNIYLLVLLVRVLLSWFPNLDWSNPVLSGVSAITDPYLNAFRGLIPPLGGLDLSAILAFLAIQLLQSLLQAGASMVAGGMAY
jgi:YggT family protein